MYNALAWRLKSSNKLRRDWKNNFFVGKNWSSNLPTSREWLILNYFEIDVIKLEQFKKNIKYNFNKFQVACISLLMTVIILISTNTCFVFSCYSDSNISQYHFPETRFCQSLSQQRRESKDKSFEWVCNLKETSEDIKQRNNERLFCCKSQKCWFESLTPPMPPLSSIHEQTAGTKFCLILCLHSFNRAVLTLIFLWRTAHQHHTWSTLF